MSANGRRASGWAVTVVLACSLSLFGCGGCTQIGCGDNVQFVGNELADWVDSDDFTMEVCIDDRCDVREVEDARDQTIHFFSPGPEGIDSGDSVHVTLRVSHGDVVASAEGDLVLEVDYPNGRRCGGPCLAGLLHVAGDSLESGPLEG
jgi:hypothetical protein